MIVKLKEVEPFFLTGTDPSDCRNFFQRLSGKEGFPWSGSIKPKSMLLSLVIYKDISGLNTARGHLLSVDIDEYNRMKDLGISDEGIIEGKKVGEIQIDYKTQDSPPNVQIQAHEIYNKDLLEAKKSEEQLDGKLDEILGNLFDD